MWYPLKRLSLRGIEPKGLTQSGKRVLLLRILDPLAIASGPLG